MFLDNISDLELVKKDLRQIKQIIIIAYDRRNWMIFKKQLCAIIIIKKKYHSGTKWTRKALTKFR